MRLEWTTFALRDRETILEYIAADSPHAAIAIDNRIEEQAEQLIDSPAIGRPGRIPGTRELVVHQTPYIAAYRVDKDSIRILRVLHGAQDWPDDLPGESA